MFFPVIKPFANAANIYAKVINEDDECLSGNQIAELTVQRKPRRIHAA